jgi:hypothetical protein
MARARGVLQISQCDREGELRYVQALQGSDDIGCGRQWGGRVGGVMSYVSRSELV